MWKHRALNASNVAKSPSVQWNFCVFSKRGLVPNLSVCVCVCGGGGAKFLGGKIASLGLHQVDDTKQL